MLRIDLNADCGEGFGAYPPGDDAALLRSVSSANIACGFHAGDPGTMARTVALAAEAGAALGAHPGLPDLAGFGRRSMGVTPAEVRDLVTYQIGALAGFASRHGQTLRHIKPHGALYWMAEEDGRIAEAIARAVQDWDSALVLVGLSGGGLVRAGQARGLQTAAEIFADRTYLPDGTLAPRSLPNAVLHNLDEAAARITLWARKGTLTATDGSTLRVEADTICIHSDSPSAPALAARVRLALEAEDYAVQPVGAS